MNIPVELDEAAMVDGCTGPGLLPGRAAAAAPGLVTTGVYAWIQAWNEFVHARHILLRPRTRPPWSGCPSSAQPTHGADYGAQMAGALVSPPR